MPNQTNSLPLKASDPNHIRIPYFKKEYDSAEKVTKYFQRTESIGNQIIERHFFISDSVNKSEYDTEADQTDIDSYLKSKRQPLDEYDKYNTNYLVLEASDNYQDNKFSIFTFPEKGRIASQHHPTVGGASYAAFRERVRGRIFDHSFFFKNNPNG